jgi:diguanylate cyclase (GGDEF)-like protein
MVLAFILTNVIVYISLSLNDSGRFSKNKFLAIPLIFNIIIIIATYLTGWIFYIDPQGQYHRGDYFFIQISIGMFYFILLIITIFINDDDYDSDDIKFLLSIFALPVIAIIIQMTNPQYYLIWVTVAFSLMLYYIFLRELQFKYDLTSGIKNRRAFTNKMLQLNKGNKNTGIVVLDLNDLKEINDSKGHDKGDEIIHKSAGFLQESFENVGTPYRAGGDEFSILCVNSSEEQVEAALMKLLKLLKEYNNKNDLKIVFAYGYDFYTGKEDIFEVFENADKKMYEHKAKIKGYYGRRRDDKLCKE